ncbi:protein disulfide oxidoreductase DsbA [Candidatus Pantoea edessiphila]|uniref:Thiol:disulfide interchange protein n=1 Tax=Candidatus Pantoea edessiphila TaxID=2044610 RepID=A0A2P5SZN3_9GAMM|nr:DsbA family protein [Candidatus Pantoea edessiphila]PPI87795.1 protein disulfide oxidoreductase DsbA [Candidatus Pantoea edessiphila]
MKKCYIIFFGLIITFNTYATQFIDGKHYITLSKPILNQPQVVEFFSFSCQYCYKFENQFRIHQLPKNIKLVKYHIDFIKKGSILTHAWAIAIALGAENKLIKPIFSSVQNMKNLVNKKILKDIFIKKLNISSEEYEKLWTSFSVKLLIEKQIKAAIDFNVSTIPAAFVNGKYMIKIDNLDIESQDATINYFDIINFLSKK